MKKIIIAVLAVAAMVACSKEQTVVAPKGDAIGFSTFVDNATRANDLTKGNFDFSVYGLVEKGTDNALIFNDQYVNKDGSYTPPQYWIGNAQYYFAAFAPATGRTWEYKTTTAHTGTLSFNNETAVANQDLLYAFVKPDATAEKITAQPEAVKLTFNHMLSRVMFTFANGFANNSNIKLEVYDVTITDAISSADLAIKDGDPVAWSNFSGTFERNFGKVGGDTLAQLVDRGVQGGTVSASTEHFYLIPDTRAYNVTFKVNLYQAGVKLDTYSRTATIPATTEMKSGMSYNIKTTLTDKNTSDDGELYPIVFEVESIVDWDKDHDGKENTEAGDTDGDTQVDTNLPLN